MKTVTIKADSAELLDLAIEAQMNDFTKKSKEQNLSIGIIAIQFSTHTESDTPVFCSQICYVQQSKFAINPMGGSMLQS